METWKHYLDKYWISDYGRCKNITTNKLLKGEITKYGYVIYNLSVNGTNKRERAHRMVASVFIPNPNNYPIINHKDCNKQNNNVDNLEWCSYSDNTRHAMSNGLVRTDCLGKAHNKKLTPEDVRYIRAHYKEGNSEYSYRGLAKKFGVDHKTIMRIVKRISWQNIE